MKISHLGAKDRVTGSCHLIFFVGYQAKGTPGRRMIEKKIPVKAGIHTLAAYSAHADQLMLVDWVRAMPEPPKEIRLVHGEADARLALAMVLGILSQSRPDEFHDKTQFKMNFAEILTSPEGKTLEFKRDTSARKQIMRTIVAFANTAGGGIAIGRENNGDPVLPMPEPT